MELQVISKSTRYSAEVDGMIIKATVRTENNQTHMESGDVSDAETGAWLGGFSVNGESASYNFQNADRARRASIMEAVEDFIVELNNMNA